MENLVKEQNYETLIKVAGLHARCYLRFKYKGVYYSKNESIRFTTKVGDRIGILKRIISIRSPQDRSEFPLVQVNWYYTRDQLDERFAAY